MQLPQPTFADPWQEILSLLPQKITYKGAPVQGTVETLKGFASWMMQQMPGVCGTGDADSKATSFLLWLRTEKSYEADDQTRMAQQAKPLAPPQNPISDQTVAQQAAPAPVAAPAAVSAPAEAADEAGPKLVCPECKTETKGLRGFKRHVTMTHKAEWPAFCMAHGLDQKTGLPSGAPAAAPVVAGAPPPPPPAPAVAPMFGAQPGMVTSPPTFAPPAPPPPPAAPQAPMTPQVAQVAPQAPIFSPPAAMPAPAAVVPPAAVPFVAAPATPPVVAFQPPAAAAPIQAPAHVPQAAPVQAPQAAPVPNGAPTREALANMLGGPVDLIVVRLLDAAAVDLKGRVDVNQLAAVAAAKAKSEMKVLDLAQSQYGQGKQAAQRHFSDLLTQTPNVYLLLNGYDPILPDGFLEILAGRVVRFHIVQDQGRSIIDIF